MTITVTITASQRVRHFPLVELSVDGRAAANIDIDFSPLSSLGRVDDVVMDLLTVASVAYAVDKIIPRSSAVDGWTRELNVRVPVRAFGQWQRFANEMSATLGFLTGDRWALQFDRQADEVIQWGRDNVHRQEDLPSTVCLFSGGIDSLVGALDYLAEHADDRLYLVGHHDPAVPGPLSDQKGVLDSLSDAVANQMSPVLVRIAPTPSGDEITLRSRSFLFLALGVYVAATRGAGTRLLIPENGTIAINHPLNASRRGACSTRTAHPFFIARCRTLLQSLGLNHPVDNPLEMKTKGEAVAECGMPDELLRAVASSNSCAKRNRRTSWLRRNVSLCGRCMPCIYRRAALNSIGNDNEVYGFDFCAGEVDINANDLKGVNDVRACLGLLRQAPTVDEIARRIIANGRLDVHRLRAHAGVVSRALDEVRALIRAKGNADIKAAAGV